MAIGLMSLSLSLLSLAEEVPPKAVQQIDPAQEQVDATFTKLEEIRIPKVSMEDTTIEEAVDFLRLRLSELEESNLKDKALPRQPRVTKVGDVNPDPDVPFSRNLQPGNHTPRINFSATNVTFAALVREFAKQIRVDVYVTSVGIVFCRSGQPPFPDEKAAAGKKWKQLFKYEPPPTGAKP